MTWPPATEKLTLKQKLHASRHLVQVGLLIVLVLGAVYSPWVTPTEADRKTVIKQGMLEESNIDAIEEMVTMIELNRSFDPDQRMTTIQDGTLDKALEIGRV